MRHNCSCDSLDENMSINNSSLSTTFTTAGREKELLAPILVFCNENAARTRIVYCLAFHPSPCMLKYQ